MTGCGGTGVWLAADSGLVSNLTDVLVVIEGLNDLWDVWHDGDNTHE